MGVSRLGAFSLSEVPPGEVRGKRAVG